MSVDHYARSGQRWATGATRVYAPIAEQLVASLPEPLTGRTVLDAGAGTGVACVALQRRGRRPAAVDFSFDMLAWQAQRRPPAAVADICALPLAPAAVDHAVAAFVLNHLTRPVAGFGELVRVTRPGGTVVACVYSNASRSEARDRVDQVARAAGWQIPDWYLQLKSAAVPLLGTASAMGAAARASGLVHVVVDERVTEVGVNTPEELVEYRFGQAHFADWLDEIGDARAEAVRQRAADAVRPIMRPYRPVVVFLSAQVH